MSDRTGIYPGTISWSGENHCLYLEAGPQGPWTAAFNVFRIHHSPFGAGQGVIALTEMDAPGAHEGNFCLSDNEPLFRWLASDFASNFGAFKDRAAYEAMSFAPLLRSSVERGEGSYRESFHGDGVDLLLEWSKLQEPLFLELPMHKVTTKKHEVYGTYVTAGDAMAALGGRKLPGAVHVKPFINSETTSAYLIFSETWVEPSQAVQPSAP